MKKAIFLDKDGTLIKDVPYNVDPAKIEFYPEVGEALVSLKNAGFVLVVVSNQSGVAQGYFPAKALLGVTKALTDSVKAFNVIFEGIYFCPHYPEGKVKKYSIDCSCRKPKPGLLVDAAKVHKIDLSQSWMIGDILNDVEAGNKAGCRTILLDRGSETEWVLNEARRPDYIVKNLNEAKNMILFAEAAKVMGGIAYEGRIQKSY